MFAHTAQDREHPPLYSVPVRGGADPVRLDPPDAPPSGHVTLSPDGERCAVPLRSAPSGSSRCSVPRSTARRARPVRLAPLSRDVDCRSARTVGWSSSGPRRAASALSRSTGRRVLAWSSPALRPAAWDQLEQSATWSTSPTGPGGRMELFRVPLTLSPTPTSSRPGSVAPWSTGVACTLPATGRRGRSSTSADPGEANIRRALQRQLRWRQPYEAERSTATRMAASVSKADDPSNGFRGGYGISPDGRRVPTRSRPSPTPPFTGLFSVPSRRTGRRQQADRRHRSVTPCPQASTHPPTTAASSTRHGRQRRTGRPSVCPSMDRLSTSAGQRRGKEVPSSRSAPTADPGGVKDADPE